MQNEELIHDWMISHLAHRLSRDYTDIKTNFRDDRRNEFKGRYPDLILANHGMVLAIMEVETENTVSPEKADEWKLLTGLGAKLIIMAPKALRAKTLDLLWKKGIADKASVGSYELSVTMP